MNTEHPSAKTPAVPRLHQWWMATAVGSAAIISIPIMVGCYLIADAILTHARVLLGR